MKAFFWYFQNMPIISRFYGILIRMFYNEHVPPHFHVEYAEYKAEIGIETLEILKGIVPRRVLALVLEWAALHRSELLADWELCRSHQEPKQVQPLE